MLDSEPLTVKPTGYAGFVYSITNNITGHIYIGKKLFNSDWTSYWGSNARVKAAVTEYGSENFTRTILHLCKTRSEMSYIEARIQFENDVILSDKYYNDCIIVKINRRQIGKSQWIKSI